MIDFLYSIDKTVFYFWNQTLANPVTDVFMPFITNINQSTPGLCFLAALWLLLMWKGGKKGRIVGILLIPLIFMSDQLSSSLIKKFVERPRPCHDLDGVPVLENIHLLVPCGSGYSFPSSHAVNAFAIATFASNYFRRWAWAWFSIATLMSLSRVFVGVHYPSDIAGGAIIGAGCAAIMIGIWRIFEKSFPGLDISGAPAKVSPK